MTYRGERWRLPIQSRGRITISGQLAREDFQLDQTTEARVTGLVDLTHASATERAEKLVDVDAHARLEGIERWTDYASTGSPPHLGRNLPDAVSEWPSHRVFLLPNPSALTDTVGRSGAMPMVRVLDVLGSLGELMRHPSKHCANIRKDRRHASRRRRLFWLAPILAIRTCIEGRACTMNSPY